MISGRSVAPKIDAPMAKPGVGPEGGLEGVGDFAGRFEVDGRDAIGEGLADFAVGAGHDLEDFERDVEFDVALLQN